MKLFCDAAFQNRCPRSYTDLPMKLGWIKEFATVSPCSQSCPVFELRFWCGCSCLQQAGLHSLLIPPQTETPSAPLKAIPGPAAAPADTCPAINALSCWMELFHGKSLWIFPLMETSQSCCFTLLSEGGRLKHKKVEGRFSATSLKLLPGAEPRQSLKSTLSCISTRKCLSSVWPIFLK